MHCVLSIITIVCNNSFAACVNGVNKHRLTCTMHLLNACYRGKGLVVQSRLSDIIITFCYRTFIIILRRPTSCRCTDLTNLYVAKSK